MNATTPEARTPHNLPKVGEEPKIILQTTSLHLATLLYALGCKEKRCIPTVHKTPQGNPKLAWEFYHSKDAEQIVALWVNANKHDGTEKQCKDWPDMTVDERMQAIRVTAAFAWNIKHFLAMVNKNGRIL